MLIFYFKIDREKIIFIFIFKIFMKVYASLILLNIETNKFDIFT